MKPRSFLAAGALAGMGFFLGLYGIVLLGLRRSGEGDALTGEVAARYPHVVAAAALKFLLLALAAGAVLGIGAAILVLLAGRPAGRARRLLALLGACLLLFLYLNTRFMVWKPMFYDALFNARGGILRLLQNTLCGIASPRGVDAFFGGAGTFLLVLRRFHARRGRLLSATIGAAAATAAILWGGPYPGRIRPRPEAAAAAPSAGETRPNVLILGFDSLRPDHLSCYGYPRDTSPHIDGIAARGVCFDTALVPLARTLPSWASLLTSTFPHDHGFRHMFPGRERRKILLPTLPGLLAREGYDTRVISDYAGECFGLVDMGFEKRDVPPPTSLPLVIERAFLQRMPFLVPFLDHPAGHRVLPLLGFLMINADPDRMAERVIEGIREARAGGRPFFITAFFSTTHLPYAAPYPYYRRYTDPAYRGIHKYGFGIQDPGRIGEAMHRPPEEDRRQIAALYDGAVAASDRAVGRVLEALREAGLEKDTLLLVTSDHGENLYDNGNLLEHGERLGGGDAANRIPLILYDPRGAFPPRRVAQPVSTLDVAPTLLDLLALPVPPEMKGRSLRPLLEGRELPDRPLFAETGLNLNGTPPALKGSDLAYPSILYSLEVDPRDYTLHLAPPLEERMVAAKERQVRTAAFKLVYSPTAEGAAFHLFDVRADPGNRHDLYGQEGYMETGERLKRRLFDWMCSAPGYGFDGRLHLVRRYNFFE